MDIFLEQIVTRRRRALYELLFYACWVLLVLCAAALASGGFAPFIYFQF